MACHLSDIASRPFHNLDRLGLMNERMIAVHMTQLNDDEIKRCAEAKINVVHWYAHIVSECFFQLLST
jgi:5-methylthioadenosine/S-adenosylhomocysteine deaminase